MQTETQSQTTSRPGREFAVRTLVGVRADRAGLGPAARRTAQAEAARRLHAGDSAHRAMNRALEQVAPGGES